MQRYLNRRWVAVAGTGTISTFDENGNRIPLGTMASPELAMSVVVTHNNSLGATTEEPQEKTKSPPGLPVGGDTHQSSRGSRLWPVPVA